jgi:hypothetical protein
MVQMQVMVNTNLPVALTQSAMKNYKVISAEQGEPAMLTVNALVNLLFVLLMAAMAIVQLVVL